MLSKFTVLSVLLLSLAHSLPFDGRRLIKTGEKTPAQWMTDDQIMNLYRNNVHFMDITNTPTLGSSVKFADNTPAIPAEATQQSVVQPMIAKVNDELMKTTLKHLTEFNNRYYKSETGLQSSKWLFEHVKAITEANKGVLNVTVKEFKHSEWNQVSVIARIEGLNNNQETVIVGAHQDSINHEDRMNGRAPGGDDDGSGTSSIVEAYRVLLSSQYQPLRPVEFQWYSGEEAGLLGSQAIAKNFRDNNRVVAGMMQFDMTGVPNKDRDIGVVTDFTHPDLNKLLHSLVKNYSKLPANDKQCGYGCSDHASWNRAKYPSAFPFESSKRNLDSKIHTPNDTYDTVDFVHMQEFSKIAVAFVVEMSHQ